jgi:hypothetical protein
LNALGLGDEIENGSCLSILLYADDIVILAKNEQNLQLMLDCLCEWCQNNHMLINMTKSNVVHFRTMSMQKSQFVYECNDEVLQYTQKYTYLGLTLNDFLDYKVTAKFVSHTAGRALGLLIAKFTVQLYRCNTKQGHAFFHGNW